MVCFPAHGTVAVDEDTEGQDKQCRDNSDASSADRIDIPEIAADHLLLYIRKAGFSCDSFDIIQGETGHVHDGLVKTMKPSTAHSTNRK